MTFDDAPPDCPWCGSPCPDETCTCSLRGEVLNPFFSKPVPAKAGKEGRRVLTMRSKGRTRLYHQ